MNEAISINDLTQKFLEFENEMNLLDGRTSTIWEGIRLDIYSRLNSSINGIQSSHDSGKNFQDYGHIKKWIVLATTCLQELVLFPQRMLIAYKNKYCKILFISGGRRKKEADGFFWDVYIDPLVKFIGKENYLLLEKAAYFDVVEPENRPN